MFAVSNNFLVAASTAELDRARGSLLLEQVKAMLTENGLIGW